MFKARGLKAISTTLRAAAKGTSQHAQGGLYHSHVECFEWRLRQNDNEAKVFEECFGAYKTRSDCGISRQCQSG